MKLSEAKAQTVWSFFREICQVPRPSRHEEKICEWLERIARGNNLQWRRDTAGNMVLIVPPSRGYEQADGIIIQSHLDMVCERAPSSGHDFSKDPIRIVEDNGWVHAEETTLGADNGMGVALALALARQQSPPHARLELLFTVDEETGLGGAKALADDFITGSRMLNLDSEQEGVFIIGCASGVETEIRLPINRQEPPPRLVPYVLSVSKLRGGHSGVNIHEQRANAIELVVRSINALSVNERLELRVAEIQGGSAHNVIPREARATIYMEPGDREEAESVFKEVTAEFKAEYAATDPELSARLDEKSSSYNGSVPAENDTQRIMHLLTALPHGVHRFSDRIPHLVETSNNLAMVKALPAEDCL